MRLAHHEVELECVAEVAVERGGQAAVSSNIDERGWGRGVERCDIVIQHQLVIQPGPGEKIAAALLAFSRPLLVGGWRKYRAIEAEVVARAMVRSATRAAGGAQVRESDEIQRLGE